MFSLCITYLLDICHSKIKVVGVKLIKSLEVDLNLLEKFIDNYKQEGKEDKLNLPFLM